MPLRLTIKASSGEMIILSFGRGPSGGPQKVFAWYLPLSIIAQVSAVGWAPKGLRTPFCQFDEDIHHDFCPDRIQLIPC